MFLHTHTHTIFVVYFIKALQIIRTDLPHVEFRQRVGGGWSGLRPVPSPEGVDEGHIRLRPSFYPFDYITYCIIIYTIRVYVYYIYYMLYAPTGLYEEMKGTHIMYIYVY